MKRIITIIFSVLVLIGLGFLLSGAGSFTYKTPASNLSEKMNLVSTKLATLPDPNNVSNQQIFVSPMGRIAVYTGQNLETKKYYFGVNDKFFEGFDRIYQPVFNSVGTEGFIVSVSGLNKSLYYFASGKVKTIFDVVSDSSSNLAVFSPDGRKFAYISGFAGRKTLVIGNEQYGPYENVSLPVFSPDSKKIVFIAERAKKMFVVNDGIEGKPYEFVSAPAWSGDSSQFSYIAVSKIDSLGSKNECLLFYKNTEKQFSCNDKSFMLGILYHTIAPVINFDGSKIAYPEVSTPGTYSKDTIVKPVKIHLVVNEKTTKTYEVVANPEFSKDSGELSFISANGDIAKFVYGNSSGKDYSDISNLSRVSNGISAYSALRFSPKSDNTREWVVVFGDKEIGPFDGISNVLLNKDGSKVAYTAFKNNNSGDSVKKEYFVGFDGKKSGIFELTSGLSWSNDGKKLAFVGRKNGGETVSVNLIPQKKYDQIFTIPKWSDDDLHLGYGVRIGNDIWWIVDEIKF